MTREHDEALAHAEEMAAPDVARATVLRDAAVDFLAKVRPLSFGSAPPVTIHDFADVIAVMADVAAIDIEAYRQHVAGEWMEGE